MGIRVGGLSRPQMGVARLLLTAWGLRGLVLNYSERDGMDMFDVILPVLVLAMAYVLLFTVRH